jgi:hypothetical protein
MPGGMAAAAGHRWIPAAVETVFGTVSHQSSSIFAASCRHHFRTRLRVGSQCKRLRHHSYVVHWILRANQAKLF